MIHKKTQNHILSLTRLLPYCRPPILKKKVCFRTVLLSSFDWYMTRWNRHLSLGDRQGKNLLCGGAHSARDPSGAQVKSRLHKRTFNVKTSLHCWSSKHFGPNINSFIFRAVPSVLEFEKCATQTCIPLHEFEVDKVWWLEAVGASAVHAVERLNQILSDTGRVLVSRCVLNY